MQQCLSLEWVILGIHIMRVESLKFRNKLIRFIVKNVMVPSHLEQCLCYAALPPMILYINIFVFQSIPGA
jgi:hypothetical protein